MAKYFNTSKDKIKSILLDQSEKIEQKNDLHKRVLHSNSENDIDSLLNELQVYQLELEMRNDELKLSYDKLDAQREKFSNLYDSAPVGYLILDHLGIIEDVNETGVNLLGFSKLTLQNKRFQSFISTTHLDRFYSFLNAMQGSNGKKNVEVKLQLSNQQSLYTRIEGIMIPSIISSNIKYYITIIDVTQSRKAQQQLTEAQERLQMTLKASSTGIWSVERESNQITLDEYSFKILEQKPSEFDGTLKNFFFLIHPEDQLRVHYAFMNGLTNSTEIDLEFQILTKEGKRKDIAAKGQQITVSEDRKLFAGTIMDITERKNLLRESELRKINQQRAVLSATLAAQESERNNISRALHDSVCQILYGIRLNLQSIPELKNLKIELKNVNQLLDQAIKETRQISYELTPSVLKDFGFTAGIKEMAQRLSTANFEIKTTIKPSIDKLQPTIQLYTFRIIQELISNIIKHASASVAEIVVCEKDKLVTIVVADNGQGFKMKMEAALRRGSGLRGIKNQVFLLNGNISFNSTKKGTSVTIGFNGNINLSD